MKQLPRAILLLFLFTSACLSIAGQSAPPQAKSQPKPSSSGPTANEGEKRFQANCGRCHNPPQTLSPREARTIVRHMRVRAMLSAEDARLILQYLAP